MASWEKAGGNHKEVARRLSKSSQHRVPWILIDITIPGDPAASRKTFRLHEGTSLPARLQAESQDGTDVHGQLHALPLPGKIESQILS
jgi:hypothetical protein